MMTTESKDKSSESQADPSGGSEGDRPLLSLTESELQLASPLQLPAPNLGGDDGFWREEYMPFCPCCPNQRGCAIIGATQAVWNVLQFCSQIYNSQAFPIPFFPIKRVNEKIGGKAPTYASAFITAFSIVMSVYFVFAAVTLRHRALHNFIIASFLVGILSLFLSYVLVIVDFELTRRNSDSFSGALFATVIVVMFADAMLRGYGLLSAFRLWKSIPDHDPFCLFCL